jgi:hypothetical protein
MKKLCAPLRHHNRLVKLFDIFILLSVLAGGARAQSTDIEYPTPVRSSEISGTVMPRDLGDSRLTRYYYSFTGTPGDLIVTAESGNLEGDVDIFTAGTLRPLAKISLYAVGTTLGGSKTVYLRTRESLILRVEARTPNDNEGSFHVSFSGSFEPVSRDIPDPEPVIPMLSSANGSMKGRRVTATGARIEEPVTEAPAATKPEMETTTSATPASETPSAENPAVVAKTQPSKPVITPRIRRTRTPRPIRRGPATTARKAPTTAEPNVTAAASAAPAVEPASGARLIIETRDGMRVERFMTTVRRVTVERGQLIVVATDGKIERHPMTDVLRMAIEP